MMAPFEIYNHNTICVQAGWIYKDAGILNKDNYHYHEKKGNLELVRRGCRNTPALVKYDTLPEWIKEEIKRIAGDPYKKVSAQSFEDKIVPDDEAVKFYSNYQLADGRKLPLEVQRQYITEAQILNAVQQVVNGRHARRKALGGSTKGIWEAISKQVNQLDKDRYPHELPSNHRRLQGSKSYKDREKVGRCYWRYINEGYYGLIHNGYGNDYARKVTADLETLILQLYTRPNKPYTSDVHQDYKLFMAGALELVDKKTGELYQPEDYLNDKDEVIEISSDTCWSYINSPHNRMIVDRYRSGSLEHNAVHRPHRHRKSPEYAGSKISMDDRDLPRKTKQGDRVKAYYAYDVASTIVLGAAYSMKKDAKLFTDCMLDMYQNLKMNGLRTPLEVEVENHLVSLFKDGMMKEGNLFRHVTWCAPGNSQQKRAEHFNKAKKYGVEKKSQEGIGRWYAKGESDRTIVEKVFDEDNDTYKEKTYEIEQLIADDRAANYEYNHAPHPNQKKYPGMSRWEVWMKYQNPQMPVLDEVMWAKYLSEATTTTIKRNSYCRVQYMDYEIPSLEVLSRLKPNNYTVEAHYIPEPDGKIEKVFLFQKGVLICEAYQIEKYQEAKAERTDEDYEIMQKQAISQTKFDKVVKDGKEKLGRLHSEKVTIDMQAVETEKIEHKTATTSEDEEFETVQFMDDNPIDSL